MSWWQEVWRGDLERSDLAMQAEHRVARSRFVLMLVLAVFGGILAISDPTHVDYVRAVPVNLGCLALALAMLVVTRRGECPMWLSVATAIGDVSLVSLLHVLDLVQGNPSMAVNGRVTFMGYFLALVGTCIRWDRRVAWSAGVVAALQYLGIVIAADRMWPATATRDVLQYGLFDWGVQVERAVVLVLFGFVCGRIAAWAVTLREHATTDLLTGLMTRRTFEGRVSDELLRTRRLGTPLSVAMVDIDHFKRINDEHGHQAGDAVLRAVGAVLSGAIRRTDLVCRWGGEEFAIVYLDTSVDDAAVHVEQLRDRVRALRVRAGSGHEIGVTISAGLAGGTGQMTLESLVRQADARLLRAKRDGRNQLVTVEVPVIS
ncbi:MAG: GGDEF domain-containing protein [Gemmatimonadetes bacterium]|nr:GGDEF domain-containing protein [Gemmatimonadota bacterium]